MCHLRPRDSRRLGEPACADKLPAVAMLPLALAQPLVGLGRSSARGLSPVLGNAHKGLFYAWLATAHGDAHKSLP